MLRSFPEALREVAEASPSPGAAPSPAGEMGTSKANPGAGGARAGDLELIRREIDLDGPGLLRCAL